MNYASLLGLMAVPGMPLPVLCVLLAVMTALSGPYKAAQLALLADVLVGGHYVTGLSIRQMTIQSAQIARLCRRWCTGTGGDSVRGSRR